MAGSLRSRSRLLALGPDASNPPVLLRIRFIGFLMSSCGGLLLWMGGVTLFFDVGEEALSGRLPTFVPWLVVLFAVVLALVGRWLELGQKRGCWLATAILTLVFVAQFLPPSDFWSDFGLATLMVALIATIHSANPVRRGTLRR